MFSNVMLWTQPDHIEGAGIIMVVAVGVGRSAVAAGLALNAPITNGIVEIGARADFLALSDAANCTAFALEGATAIRMTKLARAFDMGRRVFAVTTLGIRGQPTSIGDLIDLSHTCLAD